MRGIRRPLSVGELRAMLEQTPMVKVLTAEGERLRSLAELRAKAAVAPLRTLERGVKDVDYGADFEPILVEPRSWLEPALSAALEVKLVPAESELKSRREIRARRLALEQFAQRPKVVFDALETGAGGPIVTIEHGGVTCLAGLLPSVGPARLQVVHDDRIAVDAALPSSEWSGVPVAIRAQLDQGSSASTATTDGLTTAGGAAPPRALRAAVQRLSLITTTAPPRATRNP